MSDTAVRSFKPRKVVLAKRQPAVQVAGQVFPPNPQENLVFRGGRTLPSLTYKIFYVGKLWADGQPAADRVQLDSALSAAMSDPALNAIVAQYFGGAEITTTALPSAVLDVNTQGDYFKTDVESIAQRTFMSGALAGVDLDSCVASFVLPPGAILSSDSAGFGQLRIGRRGPPGLPEKEEEDSRNGLGGYHGSLSIAQPGGAKKLLYAVGVWSVGDNGIPIPGWDAWENVCATFYHELNEARTDPDVEDAIRTGDVRWIGWNSPSGQEIGDQPINEASRDLTKVFRKVPVPAAPGGAVPIQLLWSNRVQGPELPAAPGAPTVAALRPQVQIITLDQTLASAVPSAPGAQLSAPSKLNDFKDPNSEEKWSGVLSGFFDFAVRGTQDYLQGQPSQFYNPTRSSPAGVAAELPIKWPGFPRLLENSGLPTTEIFRRAEAISGTMIGRYRYQDEYLEWFVTRDQSNKIVRIEFTCEGPEYWDFLAQNEPDVLLALYQKHVSPSIKLQELMSGKDYNPLNVWNTTRGAMHLIQPNNSLSAEVKIAGDATILRRNPDGSLKTDAQDLIMCARYGEPGRASDPHIGDLVNGLARDGYLISIKDPVGLYMNRPRLAGFATPDGKPVGQDWFTIDRGSEDFILRGVFTAPPGLAFVVGDIQIGGVPIVFGGQVAKFIDMGLTGVAYGKGSIHNPAFDCGPAPRVAVAAASTELALTRVT